MDKSWIEQPIRSKAYVEGVQQFISFAEQGNQDGLIVCPCIDCQVKRKKRFSIEVVERHLLRRGFFKEYKDWIFHGPRSLIDNLSNKGKSLAENVVCNEVRRIGMDDMGGLLRDTFGVDNPFFGDGSMSVPSETPLNPDESHPQSHQTIRGCPLEDKKEKEKFKRLLEASNEKLYPGCSTFSKLSFLLHLFNLKCMFKWSAKSLSMLLELLLDAFPQISSFPSSYYEAEKLVMDLGLGCEEIDACPNHCMLFWGQNVHKSECDKCHTPRWKTTRNAGNGDTNRPKQRGASVKVMKYFPLIPRLQRMYMSSKMAEDMRWHHKDRKKDDGLLRHPADALAWKALDSFDPEFGDDPRSVRFGVGVDGLNPYRLHNTNHSTWPMILSILNLPPWLCMKQSSLILSLIIPGKHGPGDNIDVYLEPLIHELKLLWDGVDAFDAYTGKTFNLRGALLYTINDFPAYSMVSGICTKGYYACPHCLESTCSSRIAGKICYLGHRKWLPENDPLRFESSLFDGTIESGKAPTRWSGSEILDAQSKVSFTYGKTSKTSRKRKKKQASSSTNDANDEENGLNAFNKKSIFWQLPYWEHNPLRHNLDVMHIEKNISEIVLATLLNVDGLKCRDDEPTREFLKEKGLRPHLWLQPLENGGTYMPPAPYYMSSQDKERFLRVLAKLKVPDGYASNISRCVDMKKRKLLSLKSHDHHILMQDILPIALLASRTTQVVDVLSELSSFFKSLCSKTLDPIELDELQANIIDTICKLEMEFLPPFFTIMVHVVIHLVEEAKLGGPVQYRWMYPIERYLAHLKHYVNQKAFPEGAMAKGYILEETVTFCSRYLKGIETRFNRPARNDDLNPNKGSYLFKTGGRRVGAQKVVRLDGKSIALAHRYVLLHCDNLMKELQEEFINIKRQDLEPQGSATDQASLEAQWIIAEFPTWLKSKVSRIDDSTKEGELKRVIARGLSRHAKRLSGYVVNGYKYHTIDRERNKKSQNSGVEVEADGDPYYGKLKDIYELNFFGSYKVVVFRCDWVDITSPRGIKFDNKSRPRVNFSKLMHTGRLLKDDPFVFASQAKQVFFIEDEIEKGWLHIVRNKPRDSYDLGVDTERVDDIMDAIY